MLTHHSSLAEDILSDFALIKAPIVSDRSWAHHEFAGAHFNDQRLTGRLQLIVHQFVCQPLASIPQACGTWPLSKGAYRFFSNEKVTFEAILEPHTQRTLQRIKESQSSVILCPQDTTTLNYFHHPATQGLGHVGTKPGKSLGMLLHSTLAVSPQGDFFGVLSAHSWARTQSGPSKSTSKSKRARSRSRRKNKTPIKQKESVRWLESFRMVERQAQLSPQHLWVDVCDREGDTYSHLKEATAPECRAGLLVRAQHDRPIVGKRGKSLFKFMRKLPQAGTYTVRVPRTANHPARTVTLSVRFAQVKVSAPKTRRGEPPLTVWVVVGEEIASDPNQKERIVWCLLNTVPVHTLADAIERIQWYVKRWTIEEYHRVLKSGCQVEARQLSTRVRLQRALAVDIVVAWRIMNLSKAARLQPDAPADQWLSTNEWQALYCYVHQTRDLPAQPPRIADAVGWIAQLGGFLARRSDGHPGTTTLWRGMQRLNDIVASWQIFGPSHRTSRRPTTRPKKPLKRCG